MLRKPPLFLSSTELQEEDVTWLKLHFLCRASPLILIRSSYVPVLENIFKNILYFTLHTNFLRQNLPVLISIFFPSSKDVNVNRRKGSKSAIIVSDFIVAWKLGQLGYNIFTVSRMLFQSSSSGGSVLTVWAEVGGTWHIGFICSYHVTSDQPREQFIYNVFHLTPK